MLCTRFLSIAIHIDTLKLSSQNLFSVEHWFVCAFLFFFSLSLFVCCCCHDHHHHQHWRQLIMPSLAMSSTICLLHLFSFFFRSSLDPFSTNWCALYVEWMPYHSTKMKKISLFDSFVADSMWARAHTHTHAHHRLFMWDVCLFFSFFVFFCFSRRKHFVSTEHSNSNYNTFKIIDMLEDTSQMHD